MIKLLSFLYLLILISPAHASEETKTNASSDIKIPIADFSKLKHTKSGRIDKIIDCLTVLLKDGTIVRLTSIDIPDFHIWENAPYSDAALKILREKLPERTEIMLYQTRTPKKGRLNRMNHQLAHVVIKKDNVWIQGLLIANGLARVYTAPHNSNMLEQMYRTEQDARKNKRGIWENGSEHNILNPETSNARIGDFVIVEGIVEKTASIRNKTYLNFGKNWKTDFTVMITPALRKKFSHKGINILSLGKQSIRVRGWLREYNGPMIELEDTAHLELLQNTDKKLNLPSNTKEKSKSEDGLQQE